MHFTELAMNEVEKIVFAKKENARLVIYESFFSYHGIPPKNTQINKIHKLVKNREITRQTIQEILLQS